jgi:MinD-like ATPase involved in chromosome partitioning or flagellar assembly
MAEPTVALVLAGGVDELDRELGAALARLPGVALLPASARARADVLLIADGPGGSALDAARGESQQRPGRPVIVVCDRPGSISPREAMAAGARGLLERPIEPEALRQALALVGSGEPRERAERSGRRLVVVVGAVGGAGATSAAVALASACEDGIVVDLDLTGGDAALVAGAEVRSPDALLALATAPAVTSTELEAELASAPRCRVLPAPALPEQADLIDEAGVARVLAAIPGSSTPIVDAGSRIGVETIPALERAAAVVVVATADARGAQGARRTCALLARLGFGDRRVAVIPSRAARAGAGPLAAVPGVSLLPGVRERSEVARARELAEQLPERPYMELVAVLAREVVAP